MKKLLAILFVILFSTPITARESTNYWLCMQMGWTNGNPTLVLSEINKNNTYESYKEREKNFEKFVKEQLKLKETYEPICQDFATQKVAKDTHTSIKKRANKLNIDVRVVEFLYPVISSK